MDPEGSQGSVLVCNPSTSVMSPVFFCASPVENLEKPVTAGESGSANKAKKKRSKPKNSVKEPSVPDRPTSDEMVPSQIKTAIKVQNTIDVIKQLETVTLEELGKPKKVKKKRKRDQKRNQKEEKADEPEEPKDVLELKNELKENIVRRNQRKSTEKKLMDNTKFFEYCAENLDKCKSSIKHKKGNEKTPRSPVEKTNGPEKAPESFFPDNRQHLINKKKTHRKMKSHLDSKEVGPFEEYLPFSVVEAGLEAKTMVSGSIRINARSYKEAYIPSEGEENDILIEGLRNRNRALEGDEVVVLINSPEEWKTNSQQRTGKVVYILDYTHSRTCIGKLPSTVESNSTYVVFSPRDSRVPRIQIPVTDSCLPSSYLQNPATYSDILFKATITSWTDVNFAQGIVVEELGKAVDVEVETLALLAENDLDPNPIDPALNVFFPQLPYTIPAQEIAKRLDLRKECIFTIDPSTARDLDDAVSAKVLDNGNIEVGVHISDVSHFLQHNTLLDREVSKRATTIYLVQRCYHMLPVDLCMLCSLTAGEDKLAFSVILELTPDAHVVSHRLARTVIHSCAKLAYENAQMVIDNPEKRFTSEDFPEILNGFCAEDLVQTIRVLYNLSVIMRKRRFEMGALRIDQPKLCFRLDTDTMKPLSSFIYENKESHRLIEEFMLLANITVAKHIYAEIPKLAFLRHHLPPRQNMMVKLQKKLEQYGIHLDITDAGTLHTSMLRYSMSLDGEDSLLSWARYIILNNLCAKPMLRANYFVPSNEDCETHHYALNVPIYTHFTSPIRRYADIMVHRLLAATLDLGPQPTWTLADSKRIAMNCNRKKNAAKVAGEQSGLLFLALFLSEPVESTGAVLDVKDHSLDLIVKEYGIIVRVYTNCLKAKVEYTNENDMAQVYIQWDDDGPVQLIQLFSIVHVQISRSIDGLRLIGTLLPPKPQ